MSKRNTKNKETIKKQISNGKIVNVTKNEFSQDTACKSGVCTVNWKPNLKN